MVYVTIQKLVGRNLFLRYYVVMKKNKDTAIQPRVQEYRIAISKQNNSYIALIFDFLLLGILIVGLFLGFNKFGATDVEYENNKLMRYVVLGIFGAGFVISYVLSFVFGKAKNSQNFRDRAWMFLMTGIAYFGYMASFYVLFNFLTEPMLLLLPTFMLVFPPFMIAFLAGRSHISIVGCIAHVLLIAAYIYASYDFNYINGLTCFNNLLLLGNSVTALEDIFVLLNDGIYVASLLGMAHFLFMRHKYSGWQNIIYLLSGLLSIGYTGIFATNIVMMIMNGGYDVSILLGDKLIPAFAAIFSLIFGFIQFFGRDIEKKRPWPLPWCLLPLAVGTVFLLAGLLGVPFALNMPMFQEEMYLYLGYAILIYLLMFALYFYLTAINMALRFFDEKWSLNRKASFEPENRAAIFAGKEKPKKAYLDWTLGKPNKLKKDNPHLFAITVPEDFTIEAKKQLFLRYTLALVDVYKKDYRIVYQGKVYIASSSKIDPQTGRHIVSVENNNKNKKGADKAAELVDEKVETPEVKKEEAPVTPEPKKEEVKPQPAPIIPGMGETRKQKTLAPAPKDEPEEEEEVKPAQPVGLNKVRPEDLENRDDE